MQSDSERCESAIAAPVTRRARAVGRFEQLPKWLNLIPMIVQWLMLGLRYGSATLPSSANPTITAGGLVGEGKLEYFAIMGPLARAATAQYIGVRIDKQTTSSCVVKAMCDGGLVFPIVVKPDIGWCGYGVRKIVDDDALDRYLVDYPTGQTLLLQRYLAEDGEAGLFYARHRDESKGRLLGLLLRHYPVVTGTGSDSVATLIAGDARLRRGLKGHLHRGDFDPAYVPALGERVRLSMIASTRVGGRYEDATAKITPELVGRVDAIARDMQDFHVGRFDVRYENLYALMRGEFIIMEVNGAGSEAVHAWDPKYSVAQVYALVFAKQRLLFRIAAANRRSGHKPIGMAALIKLHLMQQGLIARYPASN